jgi:hypothetical protein
VHESETACERQRVSRFPFAICIPPLCYTPTGNVTDVFDIARRLTHAIWHMLSRNQEFAPRGAAFRLAA